MNDSPDSDLIIFTEALKLPAEVRAAYLDEVCTGDAALRKRVERLISAHEDAGDFLEESLKGISPEYGALGVKIGDRIGHYRIIKKIGEGGCGVVFLAQQDEPLKREVALKIIKPGMDTTSVISRFEAERQALAMMDHPNIAKVFDAGATGDGRPYFVMELVRGSKLTTYCDEHALDTRARLELFVQVCGAVQHAHQKGVIHRDIKPSNILVTTTEDGQPAPKVIDFGIAKATTGQRLTDNTVFTAFEMLIGTPAYMSPEQAALTNEDVDTRTDIYSLGVLLYELLTGSTPFEPGELLKAGLDEIRRVIREEEPARPSTRLGTMSAATLMAVAQHRRSEPPSLIRTVRGDLDWIALKALEKDRTRRYETANGLAVDVRRCLANETVSARPPGKLYKLQKAFQRNKLLFTGVAIIATLLVVSLIVVLASLANERQARHAAEMEEARSRQVTQFLKKTLEGVGPSVARGRDPALLREILDKTAEHLRAQIADQPVVEAEICGIVGPLYLEIGNYEKAEAMAREALALLKKLKGPESTEAGGALNDLGLALWKQRKLADAEAAFQEALAIRRRLFGNEHRDVAATLNLLGAVYRRQRKHAESESLTRESLTIRRKLFGIEHLDVADSLRNLSIILGDRGDNKGAEAAARGMLAMRRRLLGEDHPLVALAMVDLAWVLGDRSTDGEGLELGAFQIQWKVLGDEHPDLARSIYLQGERMRKRAEWAESHAALKAALSLQRRLLGDDHPDALATRRSLVTVLEKDGNVADAEAVRREAVEQLRKRVGGEDPRTISEIEGLVGFLRHQNKSIEAEQILGEALTPALLSNPASIKLLAERIDLLGRQGRWKEAASDVNRCIEHQPLEHKHYHMLVPLLLVTGNQPAYEQLCRKILVTFTDTTNPFLAERMATDFLLLPDSKVDLQTVDRLADTALSGNSNAPYFQTCKAISSYRLKRYADAVAWAEKALDRTPAYANAYTCAVLAKAHWQLGKQAEARAMLAKGQNLAPGTAPVIAPDKNADSWMAWLIAHIALNEAKALIQSPPPEKRVDNP